MKRQKNENGIRAKVKFYYWAKSRGIDLKNFDPMNISFNGPLKVSSFKNRAKEIKEKFNYKFANRNSLSLDNYPDIETMIFEPKN